jgi:hypothetical protein
LAGMTPGREVSMERSLLDKMVLIVGAMNHNAITAEEGGAMAMLIDDRTTPEWRDAAIAVLVDERGAV